MNIVLDIETTGLNPVLGDRVTCIGVKSMQEEKIFFNEDEKILLEEFWKYMNEQQLTSLKIIGFNSYYFDLQFIHIRTLHHKLTAPLVLRDHSTDLMWELSYKEPKEEGKDWPRKTRNLDFWARFIGLPGKNGSGLEAVRLFNEKKFDELKEYCINDVRITYELFDKCRLAGMIKKPR